MKMDDAKCREEKHFAFLLIFNQEKTKSTGV